MSTLLTLDRIYVHNEYMATKDQERIKALDHNLGLIERCGPAPIQRELWAARRRRVAEICAELDVLLGVEGS